MATLDVSRETYVVWVVDETKPLNGGLREIVRTTNPIWAADVADLEDVLGEIVWGVLVWLDATAQPVPLQLISFAGLD